MTPAQLGLQARPGLKVLLVLLVPRGIPEQLVLRVQLATRA